MSQYILKINMGKRWENQKQQIIYNLNENVIPMRRVFSVQEIHVREFKRQMVQLGKQPEKSPSRRGKNRLRKERFFEIRNPLVYPRLADLLVDLEDDTFSPVCIWVPEGTFPFPKGEATRYLSDDPEHYYLALLDMEQQYSTLSAELSKRGTTYSHRDIFEFRRNVQWTLEYFSINRSNIPQYSFSRPRKYLSHASTAAIRGVYSGSAQMPQS